MESNFLAVVGLIIVALTFDYINGFHDAANSIATVVSTRVLSPGKAVIWAAVFNFIAAFTFGTAVAKTVGAGLVDIHIVTFAVIFAGLVGAIVWDLITWYFGLPTSSSHALIGGYAGAAVTKAGWGAIIASGWTKTLVFIVLAPLIGMVLGFLIMLATMWIFHGFSPGRVDRWFRRLQLLSAAAYSLGHGGNDAQKTMGIIAGALVAGGYLQLGQGGALPIPLWVILAAHGAIALGTLSGGWRIITRWARRSPSCSRLAGSRRRPPARSLSSPPRISAFLSAPLTRLRVRLSASGRSSGCRRCDGASPDESCGPGS